MSVDWAKFEVNRLRLHWIINLHHEPNPQIFDQLSLSNRHAISKTISESGFGAIKAFRPDYYRLKSPFREELKACLRKRSKTKGNVKHPFFKYKHRRYNLRVKVIISHDHQVSLLFSTQVMVGSFTAKEVMFLSTAPNDGDSLINIAINKLSKTILTGDIFERGSGVDFDYYPFIEISSYQPRDSSERIVDNVPWHLLATIGERHLDLEPNNTSIVENYKNSNYTIRDDVCVFKKQSTLIVSHLEDCIEYEKYRHVILVLFMMTRALQDLTQGLDITRAAQNLPLLESLQFMYEHPNVVSKSYTLERIWRKICDVTGIMDKVHYIKNLLNTSDHIPSRLASLLDRLESLEGRKSIEDARLILELYEKDIKSAWLKARVTLEERVRRIIKAHITPPDQTLKKTLEQQITHLRSTKIIPDDIAAFMDTVRLFGNIGGHAGKEIYCPSRLALIHIIQSLHMIFDWYIAYCIKCYYLGVEGQEKEALTLRELAVQLVDHPDALIWRDGLETWMAWGQVSEVVEAVKIVNSQNEMLTTSSRPKPPPLPSS